MKTQIKTAPNTSAATTPENLKRIDDFVSGIQDLFVALALRWKEEAEHESIQDYLAKLQDSTPSGFSLLKLDKKFKLNFSIGTSAVYEIYFAGRSYGWKRIA